MKTIAFYLLGIPCILVGSRFAGLDKALIRESSGTPAAVMNVPVATPSTSDTPAHSGLAIPEIEAVLASDSAAAQQLVAVVVPERSVRVEATATGILQEVLVGDNDIVEEGAPLAVLDTQEIEADIRQQHEHTLASQSKAREAQAQYRKAQMKLDVRGPLVKTGAVTAEEYRELQADLELAAEQIQQYEAEVRKSQAEEAKLMSLLDRYVVHAPFSGKVTRVAQQAGQFLQPGDAILEIESSRKQVRALVPTDLSAKIQGLTFHAADASGGRVELVLTEISGQGISGCQEVLFDLEDSEQFFSNQTLAVYADQTESTAPFEVAPSLAAR